MSDSISVVEEKKAGNGGYQSWGKVGVAIFREWPGKATLIR